MNPHFLVVFKDLGEPGWFRVRSHHAGLGTIDEIGLEGNDHCLAVLWPAPPADMRVVTQWTPGSPA